MLTACGGGAVDGGAASEDPTSAAAGDDGGTSAIGAAGPNGGLTVQEALDSDLEGPLLVLGSYLHEEGQDPKLCTAIMESYPPQCGEPSLVVEGLNEDEIDGLQSGGSTTWTDQTQILGTVKDGVITVDPTAIG
jgi:hypothetical protein